MAIICDTREQKNTHVLKYFQEHGIPYIEKKLETGDYMNSERMDVTVDRKQNLHELLINMCSPDSSRFWREIRRSYKDRIKFYILCEHGGEYRNIRDVYKYRDAYSKVSGQKLMQKMHAAQIAYGVEFMFCDKKDTGKRIAEILGLTVDVGLVPF